MSRTTKNNNNQLAVVVLQLLLFVQFRKWAPYGPCTHSVSFISRFFFCSSMCGPLLNFLLTVLACFVAVAATCVTDEAMSNNYNPTCATVQRLQVFCALLPYPGLFNNYKYFVPCLSQACKALVKLTKYGGAC